MVASTICCIGSQDIGVLTCLVIASKCPEIRVLVVDKPEFVSDWNGKDLPVTDPEIEEIVRKCRNRNLHFNSDYVTAIRESELIFVSFGAAVKKSDHGLGKALDLRRIEETAKKIVTHAESNKVIVEKSTTPAKVAEKISQAIQSSCEPGIKIDILSNPEFWNSGKSHLQNLVHPSRVMIGCAKTPRGKAAAQVLSGVYERWIPQQDIVVVNISAAEEIKLAGTALLLQQMRTGMAVERVCKEIGLNVSEMKKFIGLESEKKIYGDTRNLINISECLKLPEFTDYWDFLQDMQKFYENSFLDRIRPVRGKSVAILGIAEGPERKFDNPTPIETCKWLLSEKAKVRVCDPRMQKTEMVEMLNRANVDENDSSLALHEDLCGAVDGVAVVIAFSSLLEFPDFNFQKLHGLLSQSKIFLTSLKESEEEELKKMGFQYENLWVADGQRLCQANEG